MAANPAGDHKEISRQTLPHRPDDWSTHHHSELSAARVPPRRRPQLSAERKYAAGCWSFKISVSGSATSIASLCSVFMEPEITGVPLPVSGRSHC